MFTPIAKVSVANSIWIKQVTMHNIPQKLDTTANMLKGMVLVKEFMIYKVP